MRNTLKFFAGVAGFSLIVVPVFAQVQTSAGATSNAPVKPAVRQEIQNTRVQIKDERQSATQNIKDIRVEARQDVKAVQVKAKEEVKAIRDEAKDDVRAVRVEAVQAVKEVRKDARDEVKEVKAEARQNVVEERKDLRSDVKAIRANASSTTGEVKAEVEKRREEAKQVFEKQRETLKAAVEAKREQFKQQIEVKQAEVKQKVEEKKAALTEKLKSIKDEKKKQTAERVNAEFNKVNAQRLANLSNILNRGEEVLKKISSRAEKAGSNGIDVSAIKAGISGSESLIVAAREAIVAQSGKVYTIEIKTEETLKNDTATVRQALQADLKVVEDLVRGVHQSIVNVANNLTAIPNINQVEAVSGTTAVEAGSSN